MRENSKRRNEVYTTIQSTFQTGKKISSKLSGKVDKTNEVRANLEKIPFSVYFAILKELTKVLPTERCAVKLLKRTFLIFNGTIELSCFA